MEEQKTLNIVVMNKAGEFETHLIPAYKEDLNDLEDFVKSYLDDEASGENVNINSRWIFNKVEDF